MVSHEVRDLLDRMQANGELPLIELHVLRAIGPTLLNRDFNNQIKKVTFGGSTRVRFSAQSLMKAIRDYRGTTGSYNIHSRMLPFSIAREIESRGKEYKELATNVEEVYTASPKMKGATAQVLVYSPHDVEDIASSIINAYDKDKDTFSKDYKKSINSIEEELKSNAETREVDDMTALKGRMSTDLQYVDTIESAVSVNHAYSVDEWAGDVDCFTATDDAAKMLSFFGNTDVSGAGMLETLDISANTFYQYANIDTRTLFENVLRGVDVSDTQAVNNAITRMHNVAVNFIEDFATIVPDAKQHSMASRPMPACMLVTTKKWARAQSADREYAEAIESKGSQGVTKIARDRLVKFANDAQSGAFAVDGFEKVYWLEDGEGDIPESATRSSLKDVAKSIFAR